MRLRRYCSTTLILATGAAFVVGCQRSESTDQKAAPTVAQERPPASSASDTSNGDAAKSFQNVVDSLAKGEAKRVTAAVPPSYLKQVEEFLARSVLPLDHGLRQEAAEAIAELTTTLIEKEEFVLASNRVELSGPAAPFVRQHFAALCRVILSAAQWSGWTSTESVDFASLFEEVVRSVSREKTLVDALGMLRFGADPKNAGEVILQIGDPSKTAPIPVEKVEGKWLPVALTERWDTMFGSRGVAPVAAEVEQRESRVRELTSRIRDIERALANVSTQQEFDALADRASTLLLATAAQSELGPRQLLSDEFVTVIITGRLTAAQKDQLVWTLASKTDEPASGIADAIDDGDSFAVTVGPVADLRAFAQRLPSLQIETVDEESKKITARFAAP